MRKMDRLAEARRTRRSRRYLCQTPFLTLFLLLPAALYAQQEPVLTPKQTTDLRDAAQEPEVRVKLYLGYIEDRAAQIRKLGAEQSAGDQATRLHGLYQEFRELADELSDNMDDYDQQHGDMRKVLKLVADKTAGWTADLKVPKTNDSYEFVRNEALDACQDVHDDATQILSEQTKYFAEQKKEAKAKKGGRP